jgi:uncharacterized cupredoxin-like copper-binding protein
VLVAGLSTSHKVGLLAVALTFIAFALVVSFVAPRRNPNFPGKGMNVFVVTCIALFVAMLSAVIFLAKEKPEAAGAAEQSQSAPRKELIQTIETEYRIQLPSKTAHELIEGQYTFHVVNKGKEVHNLVVKGPGVESEHTKNLQPGESADLRVQLRTGTYALYCSIGDHRARGMTAKLAIG